MTAPIVVVSVIGLSRESGKNFSSHLGIGKSCLCYRFIYPDYDGYVEDHRSLLAMYEFDSDVVHGDYFLYWGPTTKTYYDTKGSPENVQFEILEYTMFYQDVTDQPFKTKPPFISLESYMKMTLKSPESPGKMSYKSRDLISMPQEYGSFVLPAGIGKHPRGYLLVLDVSEGGPEFEVRLQATEKMASYLVKHKQKFAVVATKRDEALTTSLDKLGDLARACKFTVIECSAKSNVNVREAFEVIASKVLGKAVTALSSQPPTYQESAHKTLTGRDEERRSFRSYLQKRVTLANEHFKAIQCTEEYKACILLNGKFETGKMFAEHVLTIRNNEINSYAGVIDNVEMRQEFLEKYVAERTDLLPYSKHLRGLVTKICQMCSKEKVVPPSPSSYSTQKSPEENDPAAFRGPACDGPLTCTLPPGHPQDYLGNQSGSDVKDDVHGGDNDEKEQHSTISEGNWSMAKEYMCDIGIPISGMEGRVIVGSSQGRQENLSSDLSPVLTDATSTMATKTRHEFQFIPNQQQDCHPPTYRNLPSLEAPLDTSLPPPHATQTTALGEEVHHTDHHNVHTTPSHVKGAGGILNSTGSEAALLEQSEGNEATENEYYSTIDDDLMYEDWTWNGDIGYTTIDCNPSYDGIEEVNSEEDLVQSSEGGDFGVSSGYSKAEDRENTDKECVYLTISGDVAGVVGTGDVDGEYGIATGGFPCEKNGIKDVTSEDELDYINMHPITGSITEETAAIAAMVAMSSQTPVPLVQQGRDQLPLSNNTLFPVTMFPPPQSTAASSDPAGYQIFIRNAVLDTTGVQNAQEGTLRGPGDALKENMYDEQGYLIVREDVDSIRSEDSDSEYEVMINPRGEKGMITSEDEHDYVNTDFTAGSATEEMAVWFSRTLYPSVQPEQKEEELPSGQLPPTNQDAPPPILGLGMEAIDGAPTSSGGMSGGPAGLGTSPALSSPSRMQSLPRLPVKKPKPQSPQRSISLKDTQPYQWSRLPDECITAPSLSDSMGNAAITRSVASTASFQTLRKKGGEGTLEAQGDITASSNQVTLPAADKFMTPLVIASIEGNTTVMHGFPRAGIAPMQGIDTVAYNVPRVAQGNTTVAYDVPRAGIAPMQGIGTVAYNVPRVAQENTTVAYDVPRAVPTPLEGSNTVSYTIPKAATPMLDNIKRKLQMRIEQGSITSNMCQAPFVSHSLTTNFPHSLPTSIPHPLTTNVPVNNNLAAPLPPLPSVTSTLPTTSSLYSAVLIAPRALAPPTTRPEHDPTILYSTVSPALPIWQMTTVVKPNFSFGLQPKPFEPIYKLKDTRTRPLPPQPPCCNGTMSPRSPDHCGKAHASTAQLPTVSRPRPLGAEKGAPLGAEKGAPLGAEKGAPLGAEKGAPSGHSKTINVNDGRLPAPLPGGMECTIDFRTRPLPPSPPSSDSDNEKDKLQCS